MLLGANEPNAEIRSHRNRHQKVSLSWLHLYLSKVQTKEEAETIAPQAVMEYQASGFQLTPDTAGHLVNVTVRTKSDLAFMVLCNPTKYRIWPTHNVFGRLMRHYGALGDVDAVKVLWRVARDKGLQPDKLYYQFYIRAFTRSPELKDTKRALWDMAMPALRAGQIDIVGTNLMLKVCLRDPAAPRDELLAQVAKMQGNGATAKLVEEIKSTPPPTEVLPPAVEVSAAGAAAAAASMAGGARNAAQARH